MIAASCRPCVTPARPSSAPSRRARDEVANEPGRREPGQAVIGEVVFLTHKKELAEAILGADGTWRCPKLPVLDRVLNALHAPRPEGGGGQPFGYAELIRVAAWLKGEVRRREGAGGADRAGPSH